MPVDIAFELSYMLSEHLGREVEVTSVSFNPSSGELCVQARIDGREAQGCVVVKPCKGLKEEAKQARCISRTLAANEKLVKDLASRLVG
jgi:hypothetical protein